MLDKHGVKTAGILHRDIKPENILLVDTSIGDECLNGVILSDFGFSHQVSPQSRLACGKQVINSGNSTAEHTITGEGHFFFFSGGAGDVERSIRGTI